jgi:Na+/proline symporter
MWAVSVTDFVQTVMIIIGVVWLALQLNGQLGGMKAILDQTPPGFFRFLPEANVGALLEYTAAWVTMGLGSIPAQDVFQRVMSAKNERTAVWSAHVGGLMYLTVGLIPLFIGLCSKILYPELQEGDPQLVIPRMVLQHGSMLLQILFFGALLSAILSTTSGAILAPATVIGENIIRPAFRQLNDAQLLRVMRISVVVVAVCSAIMATLKTNIYELVAQSSIFSLVSLFAPLTLGLYWKRASDTGAFLSVIAGMAAWVVAAYVVDLGVPPPLLGLAVSLLTLVLGSWLRPDDSYRLYQDRTT